MVPAFGRHAYPRLTFHAMAPVLSLVCLGAGPVFAADSGCPASPVTAREIPGCVEPKGEPATRPMRMLSSICPPGSILGDECKGPISTLAGSGGAEVQTFHVQSQSRAGSGIRVEWTCPDPAQDVLVRLDLDGPSVPRLMRQFSRS
jgi:hypothetical protein